MIVTVEDIKNELDIDLVAVKGAKQAERWLKRREHEILAFIATYAYGGMPQVELYLKNSKYKAVIKEAIVEQVNYLAENNFVEPENIISRNNEYQCEQISKVVYNLLLANGLLWTGRC